MANRYIPFGYEMNNGTICIVEREAEVIRNIYSLYIQGYSLLELANRLNMLSITYASDGRDWNKNMVKRILENSKYIGEANYPQIITEDIAKIALDCKTKKYTFLTEDEKCRNDAYRSRLECGMCKSNVKKIRSGSGKTKRAYWQCSNKDCELHKKSLNEKILNNLVSELLNEISDDPKMIINTSEKDYEKDSTVIQLHNEFIEKLENPESKIEDIMEKILNLASAKFNLCKVGDNSAVTDKIKEVMAVYPKKESADGKIIEKVIRRIKIHPEKKIVIELINGKEFEKRKLKKSEMRC